MLVVHVWTVYTQWLAQGHFSMVNNQDGKQSITLLTMCVDTAPLRLSMKTESNLSACEKLGR